MDIFNEVKRNLQLDPAAKIREFMVEHEAARAYYDRWRKEVDELQSQVHQHERKAVEYMQSIQAARNIQFEAEAAANAMGLQLSIISDFLQDNFPDVVEEGPKVYIEAQPNTEGAFSPTIAHDVAPVAKKLPCDHVVYLLGELLKIRREFGGSSIARKMGDILPGPTVLGRNFRAPNDV